MRLGEISSHLSARPATQGGPGCINICACWGLVHSRLWELTWGAFHSARPQLLRSHNSAFLSCLSVACFTRRGTPSREYIFTPPGCSSPGSYKRVQGQTHKVDQGHGIRQQHRLLVRLSAIPPHLSARPATQGGPGSTNTCAYWGVADSRLWKLT